MTNPTVPLSDACTFRHGGTPSKSNPQFWGGDIPWVSPKDMKASLIISTKDSITAKGVDGSAASVVPEGSILVVARSGILAHTVPVARAGRPLAFNQDIKAIQVTDNRVTGDYVYWFLRGKEVEILARGVKKGATVHSLQSGFLEKLAIPIASAPEQHRIVDLLSRAENIVRMRREAEQKAKDVIPSLFLDMFGDPASNSKTLEVEAFGILGTLDRGRSRHRPRDAAHLYGGKYPFIQTGDVTRSGGAITAHEQTYTDAGLAQSRLWPAGTLCITIAANIAETGILTFEACFPDSVVGFLPGPRVRTDYIQQWLGFLRPTLAAQAPQAAQKNINLEILRSLRVPVPPLEVQDAFADRIRSIRAVQSSQRGASASADQAFQSLLAGVFGERQ